MPAKPDRQGQIEPPVIDRRAWIFGILETHKYSKTTLEVAGATGWKFFNRLTGETKVKAQTIADHLGVALGSVHNALWILKKDGWLEPTTRAAAGRATSYRLILAPEVQPSAKPVAPHAKVKKLPGKSLTAPPPKAFKTVNEYLAYAKRRLSALRDRKAVNAWWNSPAEQKLREPFCNGGSDIGIININSCLGVLRERLDELPKAATPKPEIRKPPDDEEIPF
jgi:hypothetical protein